jgi:hypothetical protein
MHDREDDHRIISSDKKYPVGKPPGQHRLTSGDRRKSGKISGISIARRIAAPTSPINSKPKPAARSSYHNAASVMSASASGRTMSRRLMP